MQVSPDSSRASLKRHDVLAEEKIPPTSYISTSQKNMNDTENPGYLEDEGRPRTPTSVRVEEDGPKKPPSAHSKQSRISPHQEEPNLPGTPLPSVDEPDEPKPAAKPAKKPKKAKKKVVTG